MGHSSTCNFLRWCQRPAAEG
eukprot:jgi/Astpho2/6029/gw1.00084.155.1_t